MPVTPAETLDAHRDDSGEPPQARQRDPSRKYRQFLSPKLSGGRPAAGFGAGLTLQDIRSDPQLAKLGAEVFKQLKMQFREGQDEAGDGPEGADLDDAPQIENVEAYRSRLQFWADMLETFLEETLEELDRLGPPVFADHDITESQ